MQGAVRALPQPDHGRGKEHDPAVSESGSLQEQGRERAVQTQVAKRPSRSCSVATLHHCLHNREKAADPCNRHHLFYGERVMDIPDGLPKWSGLDQSSEPIEDSPPELVREHERKKENKRKREEEGQEDGEDGEKN